MIQPVKQLPLVDHPRSLGQVEVIADIHDGEQTRSVLVCIDTGASSSCIGEVWARALRLRMETTKEETHRGVAGIYKTDRCTNYTMNIGFTNMDVHATVVQGGSVILIGMNTLRKYQMNILLTRDVLQIGRIELPIEYRYKWTPKSQEASNYGDYVRMMNRIAIWIIPTLTIATIMSLLFYYLLDKEGDLWMEATRKAEVSDFLDGWNSLLDYMKIYGPDEGRCEACQRKHDGNFPRGGKLGAVPAEVERFSAETLTRKRS